MFEIIEHEQQVLLAQMVDQLIGTIAGAIQDATQSIGNRGDCLLATDHGCQRHKGSAIHVHLVLLSHSLDSQASLANATWPHQGQELTMRGI
jgi:hypothetical protein